MEDYPLVNVYIANWKITMLLIGKSTIFRDHVFNSYVKLPEGILYLIIVLKRNNFAGPLVPGLVGLMAPGAL
jgi:hypothetical protein